MNRSFWRFVIENKHLGIAIVTFLASLVSFLQHRSERGGGVFGVESLKATIVFGLISMLSTILFLKDCGLSRWVEKLSTPRQTRNKMRKRKRVSKDNIV